MGHAVRCFLPVRRAGKKIELFWILYGCFTADQKRRNDFMNRFFWKDRSSFFSFGHLLGKKLHGFVCDDRDLLSDSTCGDDGFPGYRGVVKTNDLIGIGKLPISLKKKI